MRKYIAVFIFLIFPTFFVQAQEADAIISNLKLDLKKKPDAKKTATIYSDLTWYYSTVSIDSALYYGGKAIQESRKLGDSTLIAQVYSDVGAVYFRKGDFQSSKENYLIAYKIRKDKKDYRGLAKINNNLANIYEKNGQYKLAMTSFLDALQYFESIKDEKNSHITKGNIGLILLKLKNYPKAFTYINDVVEYQEENKATAELCVSCLNLGNVYLQMNDTLNALKQYNKSLKYCNIVGNKKGVSSAYNNIASIKTEQKKSKEALLLYAKSQKAREQLNSDIDRANFDFNIGEEYLLNNKLAEAKQLFLNTKQVFEKEKLYDKLQINYKSLIRVYAKLNQLDSVSLYVNKLVVVNNQLLENLVIKQTAELETKYQTEKKEKLLLQKEAEAKQKNSIVIAISLLAFFIALVGFLIYRQQKQKNQQQEQEFELKTAISQIETQNKLQEQRLHISRDLHDNIGAQLTFIISSVENIKYGFDIQNEKLNKKLSGISEFAKSTIVELRDTIWAMNNNAIRFEDLKSRILNFIEKAKMAKEGIQFEFYIQENLNQIELSSIVGMNIYRTIQEAINNAIKYSNATKMVVTAVSKNNQLLIEIEDNGNGFDIEKVDLGNGLNNIKKRADEIEATIDIKSQKGLGTKISLSMNIKEI